MGRDMFGALSRWVGVVVAVLFYDLLIMTGLSLAAAEGLGSLPHWPPWIWAVSLILWPWILAITVIAVRRLSTPSALSPARVLSGTVPVSAPWSRRIRYVDLSEVADVSRRVAELTVVGRFLSLTCAGVAFFWFTALIPFMPWHPQTGPWWVKLLATVVFAAAAFLLWLWEEEANDNREVHALSIEMGPDDGTDFDDPVAARGTGLLLGGWSAARLIQFQVTAAVLISVLALDWSMRQGESGSGALIPFLAIFRQFPHATILLLALPLLAVDPLMKAGSRRSAIVSTTASDIDGDDFVLYLRGFDEDALKIAMEGSRTYLWQAINPVKRYRFEELIAGCFAEAGQVVAVSPPGQELAPLGVRRLLFSNETWQEEVKALMKRCQAVIISATPDQMHDGLAWEIATLNQMGDHIPWALLVAPWPGDEATDRFSRFTQSLPEEGRLSMAAGLEIPRGLLMLFRKNSTWHVLHADTRDDTAYALAISRWRSEWTTSIVGRKATW